MAVRASRINVFGRVQRVGYRRFVLDTAQELGVAGYVRNEVNGSVVIFAQGESERMKELLKRLRSPPPPAMVKDIVQSGARARPNLRHFGIKFGTVQEELQEGFGAVQTEFQDYRGEFRDYRDEFRDYRDEFRGFAKRTDENFKTLGERYGEISEKLTNILETLIAESTQTRQALNETMRLLREAVERISQKG
ncbi:MAG: acylphosphatase [Thaumarchaeota archaeon]|nr:acylphosphatase [Nitrososphaerota archaeon]